MSVVAGRRAENVARILDLRNRGLTSHAIADQTGLAYSTVRAYLSDPDGSADRARKDRYRGVCEACGASTDGSNGVAKAPKLCLSCAAVKQHQERYWTPERVIEALQRFAGEHGEPPKSQMWLNGDRPDYAPDVTIVQREFGSWNAALVAAGLTARGSGRRGWTEEQRRQMSEARTVYRDVDGLLLDFIVRHGRVPKAEEMNAKANGWDGPCATALYNRLGGGITDWLVQRLLAMMPERDTEPVKPKRRVVI